jgi:hypothetical protein
MISFKLNQAPSSKHKHIDGGTSSQWRNQEYQSGKALLFWSTQRQLYSLFDHSGEKSSAIPAMM